MDNYYVLIKNKNYVYILFIYLYNFFLMFVCSYPAGRGERNVTSMEVYFTKPTKKAKESARRALHAKVVNL
jgi:hypothetical protein